MPNLLSICYIIEPEVLLFEPAETRNTGDVETEQTRTDLERLG